MKNHPFIRTVFLPPLLLLMTFLTGVAGAWMMVFYQSFTWREALTESCMIAFIWLLGIYHSWYISQYAKVWTAKVVIGLFLQLFSLFLVYIILVATGIIEEDTFILQIPLLIVCGTLLWIIGMQWYATQKYEPEESEEELPEDSLVKPIEKSEWIRNLSVKNGTHIHIIPIEEVFFIQACGDYVNIFTVDGQFIKEQTMKSLETSLPITFIRIHRSTIINSSQLLRIELFGKESYHVLLKNGTSLKASLAGYKLLKNRLNL